MVNVLRIILHIGVGLLALLSGFETVTANDMRQDSIQTDVKSPEQSGSPRSDPDPYEDNDTCAQAKFLQVNGTHQVHSFHDTDDSDWITIDAMSGQTYRLRAIPPSGSVADIGAELYSDCAIEPSDTQNPPFSPGVQLTWTAPTTGQYFVRLSNFASVEPGDNTEYSISIASTHGGFLVVIGGRLRVNDSLQPNINSVANRVVSLFQAYGFGDSSIAYLNSDPAATAADAPATLANLSNVIASIEPSMVGSDRPFTLYYVGHGSSDLLYLDETNSERLSTADLDSMLATLETNIPDNVPINVVIESSKAGSFIQSPNSVSKPGRRIVASTSATSDGYTSQTGAIFSDSFLTGIGSDSSLGQAFISARAAANASHPNQDPWLDVDGDTVPNEAEDYLLADELYLFHANSPCYILSTTHSGTGLDPIAAPARSWNCAPGSYVAGEVISMTAIPDANWHIANWSGTTNNSSTEMVNYVVMPASNHVVHVTYMPSCYTLARSHTGSGNDPVAAPTKSALCGANGQYVVGEPITVTASAAPGWRVSSWSGTVNDASTAAANSLVMPASNHTVQVVYTQTCYTLARSHTGSGNDPVATPTKSAICGAAGQYVAGETISLTASATAGWRVGSWSGTANDASTEATNTLVMPASNHAVQITYLPKCYYLTRTHFGNGMSPAANPAKSAACAAPGEFMAGETIALTAEPTMGWQVAFWSGTANDASTEIANSLIMPPAPHTVSVTYAQQTASGDLYENDDECGVASEIVTDGTPQVHTFHRTGDVDWVRFDVVAGQDYRIEVQPALESLADVDLELYDDCSDVPIDNWHATFTPGARLDYASSTSGPLYVRITNHDANLYGATAVYPITVRILAPPPANRALILVAGRLKNVDHLQDNIHNVISAVYTLFTSNGYDNENIYVLATSSSVIGYDGAATRSNLGAAITNWARNRLGPDGVLTLYMVDHGVPETFYLDELNGQSVTPADLDGWLNQLESVIPGLKVNIIIEACESGSFIQAPGTLSKPGRIVITSSDATHDAMASAEGAYFSDHLLTWLHQGYNLAASFAEARAVARHIYTLQNPWLDADGDGVANEFEDATLAAGRSFAYAGTLAGENWPPHIFSAEPPISVANYSGILRADVRDDVKVDRVWAVVYPPDYTPPATVNELQPETLSTFLLTPTGEGNIYAGRYDGFVQPGAYRIVIQAADNVGLVAAPRTVEVTIGGGKVYLPMVGGEHW